MTMDGGLTSAITTWSSGGRSRIGNGLDVVGSILDIGYCQLVVEEQECK